MMAWLCVIPCCSAVAQTASADWGRIVDRGFVKPPFDKNITCDGARQSVALEGLPEKPLGRMTFEHCVFHTKKLMSRQEADDVVVTDVKDEVIHR